jgi:cell division protease FtsH
MIAPSSSQARASSAAVAEVDIKVQSVESVHQRRAHETRRSAYTRRKTDEDGRAPPQGGTSRDGDAGGPGHGGVPPSQPAWWPWRYVLWALVAAAAAGLWLSVYHRQHQPTQLSYSLFKQKVAAGDVASVTFAGQSIRGRFKTGPGGRAGQGGNEAQQGAEGTGRQSGATSEGGNGGKTAGTGTFTTTRPPVQDPSLLDLLDKHDVVIAAKQTGSNGWVRLLIGLAPWLLLIGLFYFGASRMQRQMSKGGNGIFGFGKSKARRFRRTDVGVGFDDVAGLDHAKRDLREITEYMQAPEHYKRLGAKIPKGVLLMGSPGTGKTLLAKAVAGEADAPFYSISGSEFIEMFVGVGASRVRDMFESAKREAPAIVFIDEIDSVGRARGAGLGGGHDEREQTLNQILSEMDGFSPYEAVVVLAATNRPDVLDPALLRPGRFDRKVTLELPDKKARSAILKIHTRATPLADDVDVARIAALTAGFSGADLENLVNEAALLAGRENKVAVDMSVMLKARDKVVLGSEREIALQNEERRIIAYHESGHALAASLLPNADPPDKVTIIPRGRALGATEQLPQEEKHNLQESFLRDRLGVMLAGRCAEEIVFGETSSGAEQDLRNATEIARRMIARWGMSAKLGPVAFRRGEEHVFLGREMAQPRDFSESTAERIDAELLALLGGIDSRVHELLAEHRQSLDRLAQALMTQETLERDVIERTINVSAAAH